MTGLVRRLLVGEHHCRVIIEVSDLSAEAWQRLTTDPELVWRRLPPSRPARAQPVPGLTRRRRMQGSLRRPPGAEPPRSDTPVPALLEATGTAGGTASVAKQRLAAKALVAVEAAGASGQLVGASDAEHPGQVMVGQDGVWTASDGVLIFGPAEQKELDRRFDLAASTWSLNPERLRPPDAAEAGERRRRWLVDLVAGLCVLPLLLMVVPTVGLWLDRRAWVLLLAAAAVCVVVPVLVVQVLTQRWPALVDVRERAIGVGGVLLALLVLARLFVSVPVPPTVLVVAAAVLVAVLAPVASRLLPMSGRLGVPLAGVLVVLLALAAPIGDVLNAAYLQRLDLRVTDVAQTFAQRWWSGAFFVVTALAGLAVAATLWGLVYQRETFGRRLTVPFAPPAPVVAVCAVVYVAALLAMSSAEAGNQAVPGSDGLPGPWGGITPTWVCWSAPNSGAVGFAGRQLPPTTTTVVWLGGTAGHYALWSPDTGGATVSDQVRLTVRPGPGPC